MNSVDEIRKRMSPEKLEQLKYEYLYTDTSVKNLLKKYHLRIPLHKLVDLLPPQPTHHLCPYCQTTLVRKVSRSSVSKPYCTQCTHTLAEGCTCKGCQNKSVNRQNHELASLTSKGTILANTFLQTIEPVLFNDFDTEHKIYTCILLSWKGIKCDNEGQPYISIEPNQQEDIFPDDKSTYDVFQELLSLHIIQIDRNITKAGLEAFNEKTRTISDLSAFKYRFNFLPNDHVAITEMLSTRYWLSFEEFKYWWKWIALAEARSYFFYLAHDIPIKKCIGEQTEAVWENIIDNGSLAVCKTVIGYAIKSINDWIRQNPRTPFSNNFLKNCKFIGEKFLSGQWNFDKKKYKYYYHSSATRYILNTVLLIGTEGIFCPMSSADELYCIYKERVAYD